MPKGKLKAALATHTVNAQRYAAAKKKEAHKHDKEASVKASMSGARKAAKRRARAEGRAGTREEGKDGKGGKGGKEEEGDDVVEGAGGLDGAVRSGNGVEDVVVGAGSSKGSTPTSTSTPTPTPTTASTSTGIRPTIPFLPSDTILLLGEANFSFALSLITHHRHPGYQLLATSYDSQEVCFHKYPDAETNVQRLREAGAGVEFGVDGGRLEGCKRVGKGRWSRVIMNFPHTGSGIKDQDRNIRDNQLLLLRVLRSVAPVLTIGPANMLPNSHTGLKRKSKVKGGKKDQNKRRRADSSDDEDDPAHVPLGGDDVSDLEDEDPSLANGEDDDGTNPAYLPAAGTTSTSRELQPPNRPGTLLITLLDQAPYTLWALRQLATRPPASIPNAKPADRGPQPRYALLRSFQFVPQAYPGYAHRRTLGFKEGLSKSANEEIVGRKGVPRTWEFALNPKVD